MTNGTATADVNKNKESLVVGLTGTKIDPKGKVSTEFLPQERINITNIITKMEKGLDCHVLKLIPGAKPKEKNSGMEK